MKTKSIPKTAKASTPTKPSLSAQTKSTIFYIKHKYLQDLEDLEAITLKDKNDYVNTIFRIIAKKNTKLLLIDDLWTYEQNPLFADSNYVRSQLLKNIKPFKQK